MIKKPVVLLAEDEENLREIYSRALASKGFEVLEAKDGKEVLSQLKNNYNRINILVLDIVMPQLDGFDTLRKLRKDRRYEKVCVVVSSSLSQANDREEALELGASEYLVKTERDPKQFANHIWEVCLEGNDK